MTTHPSVGHLEGAPDPTSRIGEARQIEGLVEGDGLDDQVVVPLPLAVGVVDALCNAVVTGSGDSDMDVDADPDKLTLTDVEGLVKGDGSQEDDGLDDTDTLPDADPDPDTLTVPDTLGVTCLMHTPHAHTTCTQSHATCTYHMHTPQSHATCTQHTAHTDDPTPTPTATRPHRATRRQRWCS